VHTLRRHKYAILLAALLFVTIVESFSQRLLRPVVSDLAMVTTMLLVFVVVFERRADRVIAFIALVIAAAAVAGHYALSRRHPELPLRAINHSASLLLIGFATFVILRNIFAQRVVATDDVLGAVCGYLLAAAAWTDLFLLVESFVPGSFSVSPSFSVGLDTWDSRIAVLSNVSLGSLTSIGSNAAVAVRPPAAVLVPLEAMFGQFYIAVVVAQLVAARLSSRQSKQTP
jgi:voltage-gated potassium channel